MHRAAESLSLGHLVRSLNPSPFPLPIPLSRGLHLSRHGTPRAMLHDHWTVRAFRSGHALFSLHVYPTETSEAFANGGWFEINYLALSRCVPLSSEVSVLSYFSLHYSKLIILFRLAVVHKINISIAAV
jgi:hypothetical protein